MPHEASLRHENSRHPGSRFADVDLSDSVFADVSLRSARFDNVALTGATFRNVCLGNVSIEDANLEGMTIDGVLVSDLFRAYTRSREPGDQRA